MMAGGDGDDLYIVDSETDSVIETFRQEGKFNDVRECIFWDRYGSVDRVLSDFDSRRESGAHRHVEHSTRPATNSANRLRGNAGANRLDGLWGADDMAGAAGDDTYVVDNFGDVVTELANEGVDTVEVTEAYFTNSNFYALGANVENLVLTGTVSVNGNGNALANRLQGNDGDNRLEGFAGLDVFQGGAGSDTLISLGQGARFVFNRGDGLDYLINQATSIGALGRLELGSGISVDDLEFVRGGVNAGADDLVIQIKNSADAVVVKNHFTAPSGVRTAGLSELAFASGGSLTRADLDARAVTTGHWRRRIARHASEHPERVHGHIGRRLNERDAHTTTTSTHWTATTSYPAWAATTRSMAATATTPSMATTAATGS